MAALIRLYGRTPAENFGPLALETVRNATIEAGWCREHVNDQISTSPIDFAMQVGRCREFWWFSFFSLAWSCSQKRILKRGLACRCGG
jgi:hypothetical protein